MADDATGQDQSDDGGAQQTEKAKSLVIGLGASAGGLQVINEELRSTTEELETSEEELQSVNEELRTVNQELKNKIEEISETNDDLKNLMSSTDIATIFLDRSLRIKRYTPRALELFNLIPSDTNRPLADITHKLDYDNLHADAEEVIAGLHKILREIASRDGRYYIARLLPYRTMQDRIDGVVLNFVDVTELKRQEEELIKSARRFEQQARIFDTTLSSIADFAYTLDKDGRFIYANQALLELWGLTLEEISGKNFYELPYPHDLAEQMQRQVRQVFETKEKLIGETPYTSPTGADGYYEYIFNPVMASDGTVELIAGSTRETTERKAAEERLRNSEAHLSAVVDQNLAGIIEIDLIGKIIFVNRQFSKRIGYPIEDLLRMGITDFIHSEDLPQSVEHLEKLAKDNLSFEVEKRLVHADGSLMWVHNSVSPIADADGLPRTAVIVSMDITERREAQAALQKSHDELEQRVAERTVELMETNAELQTEIGERQKAEGARAAILRRLIMAQEDERRRIAREMHDQFGQALTALILKLGMLKEDYSAQTKLSEDIAALEAIAKQLDSDIDFLVWELRPTALDDLGLTAALTNYAQSWSKHFGVRVEMRERALEKDRLTPEIETVLYRIAQEALNNIAKYARATNVSVLLERTSEHISLIIEDNGVGFDLERLSSAGDNRGLGLHGMRERAALIGGTLEIEAVVGRGVTIYARIPAPYVPPGGGSHEQVTSDAR